VLGGLLYFCPEPGEIVNLEEVVLPTTRQHLPAAGPKQQQLNNLNGLIFSGLLACDFSFILYCAASQNRITG
jgi:hypothetical protein